MHKKNLDLIGAICLVVSGIVWALLPVRPLLVGVMLAVTFVFFLPGYTLTQVLFPRQSAGPPSASSQSVMLRVRLKIGQPLSAVDYLVFSLGLSLVIDIITGLLLNLLPGGLRWQSWTLSLALVTGVFALLAVFLRRRQPGKQKDVRGWHISFKAYALLGSALVVVILALWLAINRPPQPQPSFTQFWMLPSTQANKSCAVHIGVQNFEVTPVTYRIQVTRDGTQVASWPSITLVPQQEWDRLESISPGVASGDAVVDAQLYRLDQPGTVYREVHVTLHSCGSVVDATMHEAVFSDRCFHTQPVAFQRTHPRWEGRRIVE